MLGVDAGVPMGVAMAATGLTALFFSWPVALIVGGIVTVGLTFWLSDQLSRK